MPNHVREFNFLKKGAVYRCNGAGLAPHREFGFEEERTATLQICNALG